MTGDRSLLRNFIEKFWKEMICSQHRRLLHLNFGTINDLTRLDLVKRQKTSEYEAYVSGASSSGQVFQEEQAPSTSGNQEQDDDFD
ncbi:hypothetical protein Tco_0230684, partial [Tanacetum coccineum]